MENVRMVMSGMQTDEKEVRTPRKDNKSPHADRSEDPLPTEDVHRQGEQQRHAIGQTKLIDVPFGEKNQSPHHVRVETGEPHQRGIKTASKAHERFLLIR